MGNCLSFDKRILLFGLDAPGKTSILYKFTGKTNDHAGYPTIGFNMETKKIGLTNLIIWDVGGGRLVRRLWHHYIQNADAIVFVIDSADKQRIRCLNSDCGDCVYEYMDHLMRQKEAKNIPVLIFANKQDYDSAYSAEELATILNLPELFKNHRYYIQPCCALTGNGLNEGFRWLMSVMR